MSEKTITRWCQSGKLPAIAVPYAGKTTYKISPAALVLLETKADKENHPENLAKATTSSKQVKAHKEYQNAWIDAMAKGSLNGKVFSHHTQNLYSYYVKELFNRQKLLSIETFQCELMRCEPHQFGKRDKLYKALVCFGKFLVMENALDKGFLEKVKPLKPKRHLPPKRISVDSNGVEALLSACESKQERLIVTLLSQTGLRATEACSLYWSDINLEQGILIVRCGKGGKTRRVGLSQVLLSLLKEYKMSDEMSDGKLARTILININGQPMDRHGLRQRLERLGKIAGVQVSPHALRRTFVTLNANKGRPLQMLQMACGHSNIKTTLGYCLTSERDVIDAMKGWD